MWDTPGLHPFGRGTAALAITVLAVVALLGSMAVAFYTHFESDRWRRLGAKGFFAAMGLSALFFIAWLAGTSRRPIPPSPGPSPQLPWALDVLMPVNILTMGSACGGCTLICLGLLAGAPLIAGLAVREVRQGVGVPLILSLSLFYATPHCMGYPCNSC